MFGLDLKDVRYWFKQRRVSHVMTSLCFCDFCFVLKHDNVPTHISQQKLAESLSVKI